MELNDLKNDIAKTGGIPTEVSLNLDIVTEQKSLSNAVSFIQQFNSSTFIPLDTTSTTELNKVWDYERPNVFETDSTSRKQIEVIYNFFIPTDFIDDTSLDTNVNIPNNAPHTTQWPDSVYDIVFKVKPDANQPDYTYANLKIGSLGLASSIAYKSLKFQDIHQDLIWSSQNNNPSGNTVWQQVFPEAMKMFGVLPIAFFNYLSEQGINGCKENIGVIAEQIESLATKSADPAKVTALVNTIFNNGTPYKYQYTENEWKNVGGYFSRILDPQNKAQNVLSSIGILFKGAKETQDRLLKLERSAFGVDAPTFPGTKTTIQSMTFTQDPLYLGLNRVVRALANEVFLVEDPRGDPLAHANETINNLSRVDLLEQDIYGSQASQDQGDSGSEHKPDGNPIEIKGTAKVPNATNTATVNSSTIDGIHDGINRLLDKTTNLVNSLAATDGDGKIPAIKNNVYASIAKIHNELTFETKSKDDILTAAFDPSNSRIDAITNELYVQGTITSPASLGEYVTKDSRLDTIQKKMGSQANGNLNVENYNDSSTEDTLVKRINDIKKLLQIGNPTAGFYSGLGTITSLVDVINKLYDLLNSHIQGTTITNGSNPNLSATPQKDINHPAESVRSENIRKYSTTALTGPNASTNSLIATTNFGSNISYQDFITSTNSQFNKMLTAFESKGAPSNRNVLNESFMPIFSGDVTNSEGIGNRLTLSLLDGKVTEAKLDTALQTKINNAFNTDSVFPSSGTFRTGADSAYAPVGDYLSKADRAGPTVSGADLAALTTSINSALGTIASWFK